MKRNTCIGIEVGRLYLSNNIGEVIHLDDWVSQNERGPSLLLELTLLPSDLSRSMFLRFDSMM